MIQIGRESSRELVGRIGKALSVEPRSIQEIADLIDADRQAVTEYLEQLTELDNVVEIEGDGRTRLFARKCPCCGKIDTGKGGSS